MKEARLLPVQDGAGQEMKRYMSGCGFTSCAASGSLRESSHRRHHGTCLWCSGTPYPADEVFVAVGGYCNTGGQGVGRAAVVLNPAAGRRGPGTYWDAARQYGSIRDGMQEWSENQIGPLPGSNLTGCETLSDMKSQ